MSGRSLLALEKHMNLRTFKRKGQEVKTPAWVARDGDSLVFMTKRQSRKVKRLGRNWWCKLAACNGPEKSTDSGSTRRVIGTTEPRTKRRKGPWRKNASRADSTIPSCACSAKTRSVGTAVSTSPNPMRRADVTTPSTNRPTRRRLG